MFTNKAKRLFIWNLDPDLNRIVYKLGRMIDTCDDGYIFLIIFFFATVFWNINVKTAANMLPRTPLSFSHNFEN